MAYSITGVSNVPFRTVYSPHVTDMIPSIDSTDPTQERRALQSLAAARINMPNPAPVTTSGDRQRAIEILSQHDRLDPEQHITGLDHVRSESLAKIFSGPVKDGGPFVRTFVGDAQHFSFQHREGRFDVSGMTVKNKFDDSDNEDTLAIAHCADGSRLYLAGDGVGGAFAGEVASEVIVTITAQRLAMGDTFSSAVNNAMSVLREKRPDVAAWQIWDLLSSKLSGNRTENLEDRMDNLIRERFQLNPSDREALKGEVRPFLKACSANGVLDYGLMKAKSYVLFERLKRIFRLFDGEYFGMREPATTLVVARCWGKNGKNYRRFIAVGDSEIWLLRQNPNGSYARVRHTQPHSLNQLLREDRHFESVLKQMNVAPELIPMFAERALMCHRYSNQLYASVRAFGINVNDVNGRGWNIQDTGDIELDDAPHVTLVSTDRLPGSLTVDEVAGILASCNSAEAMVNALHYAMRVKQKMDGRLLKGLYRKSISSDGYLQIPDTQYLNLVIPGFFPIPVADEDDTTLLIDRSGFVKR